MNKTHQELLKKKNPKKLHLAYMPHDILERCGHQVFTFYAQCVQSIDILGVM